MRAVGRGRGQEPPEERVDARAGAGERGGGVREGRGTAAARRRRRGSARRPVESRRGRRGRPMGGRGVGGWEAKRGAGGAGRRQGPGRGKAREKGSRGGRGGGGRGVEGAWRGWKVGMRGVGANWTRGYPMGRACCREARRARRRRGREPARPRPQPQLRLDGHRRPSREPPPTPASIHDPTAPPPLHPPPNTSLDVAVGDQRGLKARGLAPRGLALTKEASKRLLAKTPSHSLPRQHQRPGRRPGPPGGHISRRQQGASGGGGLLSEATDSDADSPVGAALR